jgi:hypothetical protein
MKHIRVLPVLLTTLCLAGRLHAQPAAVQQFQNTQLSQQQQQTVFTNLSVGKSAPELYQGENLDVGPQHILRLAPRHLYFDVLFDSQVFYTDNANFANDPNMIGSTVFVNTLQAAITPPDIKLGNGAIATSVGASSQWYNYENNRISALDFDAQTIFLAARYTIGKWQFGVSGNYTRLITQPNYDVETYHELLPAITIQRVFPINDQMLIAIGNQASYHFSDTPSSLGNRTDINDRFDDAATLTFSWQILPRLVLQPYYRFQYSLYRFNSTQTSDRNDYLQTVGVSLVYNFNRFASARAFFNYNRKQSNDPFPVGYLEFGGGIGLSLNLKF